MMYLRISSGAMQYLCRSCDTLTDVLTDEVGKGGSSEEGVVMESSSSGNIDEVTNGPQQVAAGGDDRTCVIDNNFKDDFHRQFITPYIAYDPTLPRTDVIPCVNKECKRPASRKEEVVFVKYDANNLRYLYYCCHCGMFWTTKQ